MPHLDTAIRHLHDLVAQMIDRLILSAVLGIIGWHGLYPDVPKPLTSAELREKAKQKSISNVCKKPRKSKAVKELCSKWEK